MAILSRTDDLTFFFIESKKNEVLNKLADLWNTLSWMMD